jgi:hypothetical protein
MAPAAAIPPVTPMVLHSISMATKHRRIALTADPELEAAIAAARRELGDKPESRLVRDLAIRGARDLVPDPLARIRSEFAAEGVEWPEESMGDYLKRRGPIGEVDPEDPYRATRILQELREDAV